jgi:lysophospholipase L1-like esterase
MSPGWSLAWAFVALVGTADGRSEAADRACGSATCVNLVLDGDSISVGAGASLGNRLDSRLVAALGSDVRSHNVAVGGRPVSDCLRLYPQLVSPLFDATTPLNVIVFHAGDNDISLGHDATQTYVAFAAYVAAAHWQGWKVVVSTELRRRDFSPTQESELVGYNSMLRQNKAGADAVVDFDTDRRMTDMAYRDDPDVFSHDGIHPSNGGYALLANMLAPAVKRVAGR